MLIAFDLHKQPFQEEKNELVYINPNYVISVLKSNIEGVIEINTAGMSDATTHEWMIRGDLEETVRMINAGQIK